MGYLTKYGSVWGQIPNTAGRVFWVAPSDSYTVDGRSYSASNDNDGLSPERALRRVDRAVNLATASGDVVVLLPGAHTVTGAIAMDTAGVTLMGLPNGKGNRMYNKATLASSAADETVNVTAADCEIAYITLIATTSQAAALVDFSAAGDRLYVHDCTFDFTPATAATAILGINAAGAANFVLVEDCVFHADGAFGAAIGVGAALDMAVRGNLFLLSAGTWAAVCTTGAACDRVVFYENYFHAGNATMTAGVLGTTGGTASAVLFARNVFPDSATVAVDTYDAGTAELAENYQSGVGATDGGVLITAIT